MVFKLCLLTTPLTLYMCVYILAANIGVEISLMMFLVTGLLVMSFMACNCV